MMKFAASSFSLVALVAVACLAVAPAKADTYLGPQVIIGQFTHNEADPTGNLQFTGLYGLFELWHTENRFDFHAEGIPVWSPAKFGTSEGSSSRYAAVGEFDAVVHAAVDRDRRLWVGAGLIDFNDRIDSKVTLFVPPFGPVTFPVTASSRLSGARYELRGILPAGPRSWVELQLADMPSLNGGLHLHFANPGITAPDSAIRATAFSTLAAYGWNQHQNQYLIGWRSTNYPVTLQPSGRFVFRNVIGGLYFETRFRISR